MKDDPICKGLNIWQDEESLKEFLGLAHFWMKDGQSFLAVEEATGEAVGLLIGRVHWEQDYTITMSKTRVSNVKSYLFIYSLQGHWTSIYYERKFCYERNRTLKNNNNNNRTSVVLFN